MSAKVHIVAFLFVHLVTTQWVSAQFIQFSFYVDTEVRTSTLTELDFGQIMPNSENVVSLGDFNMGIFSITGLASQMVHVRLIPPTVLTHESFPGCISDDCRVALEISSAVMNAGLAMGVVDGITPIPVSGLNMIINRTFAQTLDGSRAMPPFSEAYVYVFGSLSAKDVFPGVYTGELILEVEFD